MSLTRAEHRGAAVSHHRGGSFDDVEVAVLVGIDEHGGRRESGRQRRAGHEESAAGAQVDLRIHDEIGHAIAVQINLRRREEPAQLRLHDGDVALPLPC